MQLPELVEIHAFQVEIAHRAYSLSVVVGFPARYGGARGCPIEVNSSARSVSGDSEKDWLILNRRIYQIKLMARANNFDAQRNSPEPTLSMRRKSNNWDNGDDSVDRSLVKLDCKFVFCNPCLGCLVAPSVVQCWYPEWSGRASEPDLIHGEFVRSGCSG